MRQFHIDNTKAAIEFMQTVPPNEVNLSNWCGSCACLGGWLTRSPYFQKLGLRGTGGMPAYTDQTTKETRYGIGAGVLLFGTPTMFESRLDHERGGAYHLLSDYDVAMHRLKNRLALMELDKKMTPTEVFDRLIVLLCEDNGMQFEVSPAEREAGEAAVASLLKAGWVPDAIDPGFNDSDYEYEDDMVVMSQGEESDIKTLVKKWGEPMAALDKVMNEVFGE